MGILGLRLPRLPNLKKRKRRFYSVTVKVDDREPHNLNYVWGGDIEKPVILHNRYSFFMPEDTKFVDAGEEGLVKVSGELLPAKRLQAVSADSFMDDMEEVEVPPEFLGAQIPKKDTTKSDPYQS